MQEKKSKNNKEIVIKLFATILLLVGIVALLLGLLFTFISVSKQKELDSYNRELLVDNELVGKDQVEHINLLQSSINWYGYANDICVNLGTGLLMAGIVDLLIKKHLEHLDEPHIKEFFSRNGTDDINAELNKFLDNNKNKIDVEIICYGTGGFGGKIETLIGNSHVKSIKVVVCSQQLCGKISSQVDSTFSAEAKQLSEQIGKWQKKAHNSADRKSEKLTVYESPVLPTIRSICIKAGNKPVFCTFSPYYMKEKYDQTENLMTADVSSQNCKFAIIMDKEDKEIATLSKFLSEEFKRLSELAGQE